MGVETRAKRRRYSYSVRASLHFTSFCVDPFCPTWDKLTKNKQCHRRKAPDVRKASVLSQKISSCSEFEKEFLNDVRGELQKSMERASEHIWFCSRKIVMIVTLFFFLNAGRKVTFLCSYTQLLWNFPTQDKNKALNRENDVTNTVDKPDGFYFHSIFFLLSFHFFHLLALMRIGCVSVKVS